MATTRNVPIGIADESVPEGIHLCYVYNDDAEREQTLARFVAKGLAENARVLCLVDAMTPQDFESHLRELGVDLGSHASALTAADAVETYSPPSGFSPDTLLDSLSAFCQQAVSEGYSGVRITGDMAWLHRSHPAMTTVMEYEVKATDHCRAQRVVALCQYDARKFDGRTIMDVLSVHPAMIVGGQVVKNPYYIEPREFMTRYQASEGADRRA